MRDAATVFVQEVLMTIDETRDLRTTEIPSPEEVAGLGTVTARRET